MARVLDDIVHYFKQEGQDILATDRLYTLMLDHYPQVWDALARRAYPEADLMRSVVEAERLVNALEEQVRDLWADRRRLKHQLEAALTGKVANA
jgi:hypothetical protein